MFHHKNSPLVGSVVQFCICLVGEKNRRDVTNYISASSSFGRSVFLYNYLLPEKANIIKTLSEFEGLTSTLVFFKQLLGTNRIMIIFTNL